MNLQLEGKVALITGASGGIGRSLAEEFDQEKCRLVLHANRNPEPLRQWIGSRSFHEEPLVVQGDVRDAEQVEALFERARERLGRIDLCVANAGIWPEQDVGLHRMDASRIREVLEVNLLGVIWTARAFLRCLERSGPDPDGSGASLTLIGSTAGRFGERGHAEYAVSKAGLVGLLRTLKNEIVRLDPAARVNLVEPGWTVTDMTREHLQDDQLVRRTVSTMALRRIALAEDVARVVVTLASPAASRHVTGQTITVAGGMEGRQLWTDEEIDADEVRRQT